MDGAVDAVDVGAWPGKRRMLCSACGGPGESPPEAGQAARILQLARKIIHYGRGRFVLTAAYQETGLGSPALTP